MNGTHRPTATPTTTSAAQERYSEFLWSNGYDTNPSERHLADIRTAHYAGLHDADPCQQCTKCNPTH